MLRTLSAACRQRRRFSWALFMEISLPFQERNIPFWNNLSGHCPQSPSARRVILNFWRSCAFRKYQVNKLPKWLKNVRSSFMDDSETPKAAKANKKPALGVFYGCVIWEDDRHSYKNGNPEAKLWGDTLHWFYNNTITDLTFLTYHLLVAERANNQL